MKSSPSSRFMKERQIKLQVGTTRLPPERLKFKTLTIACAGKDVEAAGTLCVLAGACPPTLESLLVLSPKPGTPFPVGVLNCVSDCL